MSTTRLRSQKRSKDCVADEPRSVDNASKGERQSNSEKTSEVCTIDTIDAHWSILLVANPEHLEWIRRGVQVWNEKRLTLDDETRADLSEAKLHGADLLGADFRWANLSEADLSEADLTDANLGGADLYGANLGGANLSGATLISAYLETANLCGADLTDANLSSADLTDANLSGAMLSGAQLRTARLLFTDLRGADLSGCSIYGVSAWDLLIDDKTKQANLVITPPTHPEISVDNLEVAQFVYLLLNNSKIRDVIDTLTTKAVLILGRFTKDHKAVLDALRDALRRRGYLPILFDFEKPGTRDVTETVSTLAHLSRFIIADLTNPKSIPQELATIIPHLPSVPVQPLILEGNREYGMFEHFPRYPWVLPIYHYHDQDTLISNLEKEVILPAEAKVKAQQPPSR